MGYHVQLFRRETMEKERSTQDSDFFEHEQNLIPFSSIQQQYLLNRLTKYGYRFTAEDQHGMHAQHDEYPTVQVLLTKAAVYFSAGFSEGFEIGMTASEFTDTNEFVKYDPQANGWEIME